jgi:hypothetical protein
VRELIVGLLDSRTHRRRTTTAPTLNEEEVYSSSVSRSMPPTLLTAIWMAVLAMLTVNLGEGSNSHGRL